MRAREAGSKTNQSPTNAPYSNGRRPTFEISNFENSGDLEIRLLVRCHLRQGDQKFVRCEGRVRVLLDRPDGRDRTDDFG